MTEHECQDLPVSCPEEGCNGRIEVNSTLWLSVNSCTDSQNDIAISVYGVSEQVDVACDDGEHAVRDPALHAAIAEAAIEFLRRFVESALGSETRISSVGGGEPEFSCPRVR